MIMILMLPLILLYFVPAIVALARGRQVGVVLIVNRFLGWTFLGWIGALAIAVSSKPQQPVILQPQFGYRPTSSIPLRCATRRAISRRRSRRNFPTPARSWPTLCRELRLDSRSRPTDQTLLGCQLPDESGLGAAHVVAQRVLLGEEDTRAMRGL